MTRPAKLPTTIKVSPDTRDKLKVLAKREECTLDQYLNKLIAMADREQRWDSLRASVAAMSSQDWEDYAQEANPQRADVPWDGATVADEWQEEWDAWVARNAGKGPVAN
ncbi:MAG: hypothetical protein F2808_03735 [Actinobacteria bacterium]|uniref:Unannotated protein n=1 Tax=freshwater metagenome TaxID=449393 RepID=A0A6J7FSH2_9ZZZZ|nr:hypothetical protein [Actinomycetota bacterium]